MRLVLARAAAARTLLVAAALAATVTTVLLTGFALYAQLLPVAATRAAIAEAPPVDRTLLVRSPAGDTPGELAGLDATIRELLGRGLAGAAGPVSGGGYASGQELPPGVGADQDFPVVGFLTDLPRHAELVAGGWPQPLAGPRPPGAPIEAAVPAAVAELLAVQVGDRVELLDIRAEDRPAPVTVVGIWEPVDPAAAYWRLLSAPLGRGGWGPFVVHQDDFAARYLLLGSLEWLAEPEPEPLAEAGMAAVLADHRRLEGALAEVREGGDSVRLSTSLDELAGQLQVAAVVNRSGLVLPAALLVVTSGFGLVLLARLLAAHRRGENALLRARGASRRQLVRFTALEALLVVAPAAVLAAPAGSWLVALADQRTGGRSLGIADDLAAYGPAGPPVAWLVAVGAAAGCGLALALPAAGRGRTWVAEQQERARPGRVAVLQRAGVDLVLAGLAVLAWAQLRRYGSAVTPSGNGLGIDPLLVLAPVVGVLAATALALRLLPLATRLGVRLAARRDTFPGLLGMWQADRRPHAGPVLLLVLAVAIAVLAPAVAATWQQSQRDQAAHRVGADLRIMVDNPSESSGAQLRAALPGATGLMPVHRTGMRVGDTPSSTLLAVDSERAAAVARLRPDLAPAAPAELFGTLRAGRPELTGVRLPAGTRRLVGEFRFTAPPPQRQRFLRAEFGLNGQVREVPVEVELPRPEPADLAVHVRDADGIIRTVPIGRPGDARLALDPTGRLAFDLSLPPDPTELVGLAAGLSVSGWDPGLLPAGAPDPVTVSWRWEGLRAVAAGGAETRLEPPDSWAIGQRGEDRSGPQPEPGGPALAARITLQPLQDYPLSGRYLLASVPDRLPLIPALVTPDLLAAAGGEVGTRFTIEEGPTGTSSAYLAGVVEALPGTVDGSGALVDLSWLSVHQLLWERPTPLVTEWWAAAPERTDPAAVAALDWTGTVHDRRADTRELLADPLGTGVLLALWAAAAAAALLAAFGLVVDSRATAVRRRRELAVLHTLGTSPGGLARALVVEQAVLAGLGVLAGLAVGVAVAAAMGTSLVLTSAGAVPVPAPLLSFSPAQFAAPTLGLFAVAVGLGALVARRARREVAAGALRIGED